MAEINTELNGDELYIRLKSGINSLFPQTKAKYVLFDKEDSEGKPIVSNVQRELESLNSKIDLLDVDSETLEALDDIKTFIEANKDVTDIATIVANLQNLRVTKDFQTNHLIVSSPGKEAKTFYPVTIVGNVIYDEKLQKTLKSKLEDMNLSISNNATSNATLNASVDGLNTRLAKAEASLGKLNITWEAITDFGEPMQPVIPTE
jgi:hypothetical protein